VQRFVVTIEGPGFTDIQEIELPKLPAEGDTLETKYGTCIVSQAEALPPGAQHDGKIVCSYS
jgi:hypothetical protein